MRHLFVLLSIFTPFSACFSQVANPDESRGIVNFDPEARFEKLTTQYRTLHEQYYALEPKEGENEYKRFLENHPMNTMVGDFMSLEQKSRGTEVGFSCLYHLVSAAASVASRDHPATTSKVAALEVLAEHYHDYPDVDTTFSFVFSGARVPESKAFLRELIISSQQEHIRANAMYELANYLALEANLPAILESHLAILDRANPENEFRIRDLERAYTNLKDVDVDRNRAQAIRLIDQIRGEYQDEIFTPRVSVRPPGLVSLKRSEFDEFSKTRRERIVDLLPAIQFELDHSIGQKAPPIDGSDAMGEPMSLADFQGNVVVVMFSFKGCGPCEAMYPDNRQLIEELSEVPFVFVGVQGDKTIDTVHESLKSKTITWRVWWDGKDKRISTRWNIRGWPSTFVLDQRGVIRFRDVRGQDLGNAVRSLLKNAAE